MFQLADCAAAAPGRARWPGCLLASIPEQGTNRPLSWTIFIARFRADGLLYNTAEGVAHSGDHQRTAYAVGRGEKILLAWPLPRC